MPVPVPLPIPTTKPASAYALAKFFAIRLSITAFDRITDRRTNCTSFPHPSQITHATSVFPTASPSASPAGAPSESPSSAPSSATSAFPSNVPSYIPMDSPTSTPSIALTSKPSATPSSAPLALLSSRVRVFHTKCRVNSRPSTITKQKMRVLLINRSLSIVSRRKFSLSLINWRENDSRIPADHRHQIYS